MEDQSQTCASAVINADSKSV